MNAKTLYSKLNSEFITSEISDEWSMMWALNNYINEFITVSFKITGMGLLFDNTKLIQRVVTTTFLSDFIIKKIISEFGQNTLIFTHHPMSFDGRANGKGFLNVKKASLQALKDNNISVYTLHVPLDKNGPYSTGMSFAKAIGLSPKKGFCKYHGAKVGVIGNISKTSFLDFVKQVERIVGHTIKSYDYGLKTSKKIGLVTGGAYELEQIEDCAKEGVDTYITGTTQGCKGYSPSFNQAKLFHVAAKKHKINVIGASHYSTEKFACIKMVEFFKKLGLKSEFLEDNWHLKKLD